MTLNIRKDLLRKPAIKCSINKEDEEWNIDYRKALYKLNKEFPSVKFDEGMLAIEEEKKLTEEKRKEKIKNIIKFFERLRKVGRVSLVIFVICGWTYLLISLSTKFTNGSSNDIVSCWIVCILFISPVSIFGTYGLVRLIKWLILGDSDIGFLNWVKDGW